MGLPPSALAAHCRLVPHSLQPMPIDRRPPYWAACLRWLWQVGRPGVGDPGPRQAHLHWIYNVKEEPEQRRFQQERGGVTWRQAACGHTFCG